MRVKLIHHDALYSASARVLARNEPVTFGTGKLNNFSISGNDVTGLHFSVEFDGRAARLKNQAPTMAPVLVNGAAVVEVELRHGDVVVVGNTQVDVEIVGEPAPVERNGGAPSASHLTSHSLSHSLLPTIAVSRRELPTGVIAYEGAGREALHAAVARLAERFQPLLLANFLGAGEAVPAWLTAKDDLLHSAPREQIGANCLYLLAPGDVPPAADDSSEASRTPAAATARLLGLFDAVRRSGAAVLLFGEGGKQDVAKAIGFRRGFYASASSLELFLQQGSRQLAGPLVEPFHAIVVARDDAHWAAYSNPKLAPSAADLNLAAPAMAGALS